MRRTAEIELLEAGASVLFSAVDWRGHTILCGRMPHVKVHRSTPQSDVSSSTEGPAAAASGAMEKLRKAYTHSVMIHPEVLMDATAMASGVA